MSTQVGSRVNQMLEVKSGMEQTEIQEIGQAVLLKNPDICSIKKSSYLS